MTFEAAQLDQAEHLAGPGNDFAAPQLAAIFQSEGNILFHRLPREQRPRVLLENGGAGLAL
jgi:hypothetical protein